MAATSLPSRRTTRATLIPPPPASRRAAVHRNLRVGTISSTPVETSIAGLAVRVTMDSMATRSHPSTGLILTQINRALENGHTNQTDRDSHIDGGLEGDEIMICIPFGKDVRAPRRAARPSCP